MTNSQLQENEPLRIDNSKRSSFVACPRKYYYQYVRHLESVKGSSALRYGTCWHEGMDKFYTHIKDNGWKDLPGAMVAGVKGIQTSWEEESGKKEYWEDYRTINNCIQSFIQYIDHFNSDEGMLKVIQPEAAFRIKLEPQEKRNGLKPFYFTGKIDGVIELNGAPWQQEHKTTGQALSMQVKRLNRIPQIIGYTWAGKHLLGGIIPEGTLVTVHHLLSRKKKDGTYGKLNIDFQRVPQIFSEDDLNNWLESLLYTAGHMQVAHETNCFPMQFGSCYDYGACTFSFLCEQGRELGDEVIGGLFREREPWDPTSELIEDSAVVEV